MEIVISIPDFVYDGIRNMTEGKGIIENNAKALYNAIYYGTPLPKGHGRIIDESKIKVCEWVDVWEEDYPKASTDAPTIIEADGGNEDETNN